MEGLAKKLLRPFLREADFDSIFAKALSRQRLVLISTAGMARIFGRRALCCRRGKPLPKVLVFMRQGQLKVWGMQEVYVKVEFADRQKLRFSHVMPEQCVPFTPGKEKT